MRYFCLLLILFPTLPLSAQFDSLFFDRGIDTMHYLINYPPGYDEAGPDLPFVLFLHGGGESGSDLRKVLYNGLPKHVAMGKTFPFITVAPQNRFTGGHCGICPMHMAVMRCGDVNRVDIITRQKRLVITHGVAAMFGTKSVRFGKVTTGSRHQYAVMAVF